MRAFLSLFLAMGMALPVFACSIAPGYQHFAPSPTTNTAAKPPAAPRIKVKSIERGNVGEPGMCADLGMLVLGLENPAPLTGYRFEIEAGEIQQTIFPSAYIAPALGKSEMWFVWGDGASAYQEPLKLRVKAVAVSSLGIESEPSYFQIEHPGRAK